MAAELSPQERRDLMYGEHDLSSLAIFSGSFINYGYWFGADPDRPITLAERTESQAEMYRQITARLEPGPGNRLLELGSGLGVGAALVAREIGATVAGLDRSDDQLARAAETNAAALAEPDARLSFHKGSVTDIPWPGGSFDGVYAIEMLQHVDDLAATAREIHRVLKPGGRFATATFFAPQAQEAPLADLLETVESGIDLIRPVGEFVGDLEAAGLTDVEVTSIGEHVWPYMDRWLSQTEFADTWGRNWLRCYENGWIDYYLVTARR
ncbi:class I SAM-dependent methyltransferase [Glycomyces buryatensis]|uniref:Methyltransferase domain-containing protein n=1 Tax=Glycomyces buryatensis TaxID=2570927 RepID=A0A4V6T6R7_9ACTN|nr:class I SAM-dependent methyltransferase [Glycomyces buryatensis]THV42606.1 methyltransferase domain-containing protein [Glycomyces buryatensis]